MQPPMNSQVEKWGEIISLEFSLLYLIPGFSKGHAKALLLVEIVRGSTLTATPNNAPESRFSTHSYKTCINMLSHVSHNHSLTATIIYRSLQGHVLLNFRKSFETTHHIFCQFPLVHIPYFPLDEAKRQAKVLRWGGRQNHPGCP